MPDLLDVRAQRVAEILAQRHVLPHEVQHQFVALQAGRQAAFAGDAGLVVAPLEVAEGPVAVEHLQRAANVAKRIGKLAGSGSSNGSRPTAGAGASAPPACRATSARRSSPCRGDRASGPPPAAFRAGRPAASRRAGCRRLWPRTSRSDRTKGCATSAARRTGWLPLYAVRFTCSRSSFKSSVPLPCSSR